MKEKKPNAYDPNRAIRSCLVLAAFFAVLCLLAHGPWFYWIVVGANLAGALIIKIIDTRRKNKEK